MPGQLLMKPSFSMLTCLLGFSIDSLECLLKLYSALNINGNVLPCTTYCGKTKRQEVFSLGGRQA